MSSFPCLFLYKTDVHLREKLLNFRWIVGLPDQAEFRVVVFFPLRVLFVPVIVLKYK